MTGPLTVRERLRRWWGEWRGVLPVPVGVGVVVWLLVVQRILRSGMPTYGLDGAPWIEQEARLEALAALRRAVGLGPIGLLRELDGYFPPVLHLLTLPLTALGGQTDTASQFTSILWLFLLAAALGTIAWELSRDRATAAAAATATGALLLPAAHAFATRYYYDLPMTALLWVLPAAAFVTWDRRPLRGGLLVAFLWVLADLLKWSSLAFGIFLVVGVALSARLDPDGKRERFILRRAGALVVAGGVSALLVLAYLLLMGPGSSLRVMLDQMWGDLGRAGFEAGFSAGSVSRAVDAVGAWIVQHGTRLGTPDVPGKAAFYPWSMLSAVLSPLWSVPVLAGTALWAARSRMGLPLVLIAVLGQWAFLIVWIPVIDERFLLTIAPALVLTAALGWGTLGPKWRLWTGVFAVVAGLWVAAEFHTGLPPLPGSPRVLHSSNDDRLPPVVTAGWGLADSVAHRGWARWDAEVRSRAIDREAIWQRVLDCGAELVLVGPDGRSEEPTLGGYWLAYRSLLRREVEDEGPLFFTTRCEDARHADLAVTRLDPGHDLVPSDCLGAREWRPVGTLLLPGKKAEAAFWAPADRPDICAEARK